MNWNYTLKYRTFNSVLEDIRVDFKSLSLEGKLDPQQLIKVVMRVNYDLGLRINQPQERILQLDHGKVQLPDDFYVMNFGLICGSYEISTAIPQGTNIQEVPPFNQYTPNNPFVPFYKDPKEPNACTTPEPLFCNPTQLRNTVTPACLTRCGSEYALIQVVASQTRTYRTFAPLIFKNTTDHHRFSHGMRTMPFVNTFDNELNSGGGVRFPGPTNNAWIKDNYLWTNLDCANVYINYMGSLQNDDGEIMVPDHPMINEYYEYALKERLLENLMMDGSPEMNTQLQYIQSKLKTARIEALTIVTTPNFSEMEKLYQTNRKALYGKYYQMFESYPNYGPTYDHNNVK